MWRKCHWWYHNRSFDRQCQPEHTCLFNRYCLASKRAEWSFDCTLFLAHFYDVDKKTKDPSIPKKKGQVTYWRITCMTQIAWSIHSLFANFLLYTKWDHLRPKRFYIRVFRASALYQIMMIELIPFLLFFFAAEVKLLEKNWLMRPISFALSF